MSVTKDLAFEKRYSKNWTTDFRREIHRSVGGVCVHCKVEKSAEIHHAHYRDRNGAIAGKEKPGIDLFPLCQKCHGKAHNTENWVKDKADPVLGNRNTDKFLSQLKDDWAIATKSAKVGKSTTKKELSFPWWVRFGALVSGGIVGFAVYGFWGAVACICAVVVLEIT